MSDPRDYHEPRRAPVLRLVPKGSEPLRILLDLYGPSGSGKTYSALVIAKGITSVMPGKIAMIDTEGRGNLYEGRFDFDRYVMEPPYSPEAFIAAYEQLDAHYSVIVTDTISDEYEGIGGLQEIAEEQKVQNEVAKWAVPKLRHRKLMARIRQLRAQHIFCVRAEDKIEIVEGEDPSNGRKKRIVRPLGWTRVAEKKWKYDMTVGLMFEPGARGVCVVDKTIEGVDTLIKTGQQVTEEFGASLARWAKGESTAPKPRTIPLVKPDGSTEMECGSAEVFVANLEALAQTSPADIPAYADANYETLTRIATSQKAPPELRGRAEKLREMAPAPEAA